MEQSQKERPLVSRLRRRLVRREILYQAHSRSSESAEYTLAFKAAFPEISSNEEPPVESVPEKRELGGFPSPADTVAKNPVPPVIVSENASPPTPGYRDPHTQPALLRRTRLRFWTAFKEYMVANSQIPCTTPSSKSSMAHALGRADSHLSSVISRTNSLTNTFDPEIRVEFVLKGGHAKHQFATLEQKKDQIEQATPLPPKCSRRFSFV